MRRLEVDMGRRRTWLSLLVAGLVLAMALGLGSLAVGCGSDKSTDETSAGAEGPKVEVIQDGIGILGLGAGPKFWPDRNNTGIVLYVNSFMYMVDIGGGTPQELYDLGQGFSKMHDLFVTHLHFDHTGGLAELLARGYQTRDTNAAGVESPLASLDIYGPPGTQSLTDGLMEGLAGGFDLHNWQRAAGTPWLVPKVHELALPETGVQVIFEDKRVRVSATRVDHDVDVEYAYAYRFDILDGANKGKSVVFSGDRNDDNANRDPAVNQQFRAQFRELSKGATALVHEVGLSDWAVKIADPTEGGQMEALYKHLVNSHTDAAVVVTLAADLNVPVLVLQHYGNIGAEYTLQEARDFIYDAVMKANKTAGYKGQIIAPMEGDVVQF
jgi:ribonuclease BN (tRNA processing enzyme)